MVVVYETVRYNTCMNTIRFTKQGYETLKKERETVLKRRPLAVLELAKAREMGDLSENGYYKAAKAELVNIDRRLREIAYTLTRAVVIENTNNNSVGIGSRVTLQLGEKEMAYKIVGDLEANPSQGMLSLKSPLGKALYGKRKGENTIITTPNGTAAYKIVDVT